MAELTEEQRNELAEKVVEKIVALWGDEFSDEDTVLIYEFCRDEVEGITYPFDDDVVHCVAIEFDLKYG